MKFTATYKIDIEIGTELVPYSDVKTKHYITKGMLAEIAKLGICNPDLIELADNYFYEYEPSTNAFKRKQLVYEVAFTKVQVGLPQPQSHDAVLGTRH